jgi:protocatechuate 3,4-dioxygenase alpha subunit
MTTPSQTVGPFFSLGLDERPCPEGPARLEGRVLDGAGEPVPDAVVEVWSPATGWGRSGTDASGRYAFTLREAPFVDVLVFARGLLRPVRTRAYLDGSAPEPTLAARPEDGVLRFDIRLQGERQTAFFVA